MKKPLLCLLSAFVTLTACQSNGSNTSSNDVAGSKSANPLVAAAELRVLKEVQQPLIKDKARLSNASADKTSLEPLTQTVRTWYGSNLPVGVVLAPAVEGILGTHYLVLQKKADRLSYFPKNPGMTAAEKQRVVALMELPITQSTANITYLTTLANTKGSGLTEADMQVQLTSLGAKQGQVLAQSYAAEKQAQQIGSAAYYRAELAKQARHK